MGEGQSGYPEDLSSSPAFGSWLTRESSRLVTPLCHLPVFFVSQPRTGTFLEGSGHHCPLLAREGELLMAFISCYAPSSCLCRSWTNINTGLGS